MVQRKVSNKPGVLSDHVKSERMSNLKPTSQHQDCKNRVADLKIKMKKSRSMKLSDITAPRSSTSKRISLPGKLPSSDVPSVTATPQKQSTYKAAERSPNYMKSTSSADARRGSFLVSSRESKSFSDSKLFNKRNSSSSIIGSISGAKTLTKSYNMKLVRSLTKTPSFKNARSTLNKCSRVAICADMNAQRATCSSTMKDSKFPQYLMLNPGGNESEGTSVEKVCPYTYCSLNGHHHFPVPPLKLFLSTRRRSLKTQRGFKVKALSSRSAGMPVVEESKKIENTTLCKEENFSCSTTSPLMQDKERDFFIEIYAKKKEEGVANKQNQDADHQGNFGFAANLEDSNDIAYWGADVKQVAESLSDGPPCSEIDHRENHKQNDENIPAEVGIAENWTDAEEDSQFNLVQEKLGSDRLVYGVNPEKMNHEGTKAADIESEATDMEWEDVHLFSEGDYFITVVSKSLSESEVNGKAGLTTNDSKVTSHDEIPCDEIVGYISEGESLCTEEQFANHHPEQDASYQDTMAVSFEYDQNCRIPEAEYFKIDSQQGDDKVTLSSETTEGPSILMETYDIDTFVSSQSSDALIISTTEKVEMGENKCGQKSGQDKNVADFSLQRELLNADGGHHVTEKEQVANANKSDEVNKIIDPCQINKTIENSDLARTGADMPNKRNTLEIWIENIQGESNTSKISSSITPEEQNAPEFNISSSSKDCTNETERMETYYDMKAVSTEITPEAQSTISKGFGGTILHSGTNSNEEVLNSCNNIKWIINRKRATDHWEDSRNFNPREPNYLPLVPDPEAEKVDLRHQDMDGRKNSEEWMLDHALQKAVNKLAPARKRKVALLVEAFETVLPVHKCDTRAKNTTEFLHTRPIQACN